MNRARNSIRNIIFGLGGQILNILMSFAMRTVFIHTLDEVYQGVNGTFTNILMLFSLADLGVGTAIIYALYKPIAEDNRVKIQGLMKLYQKAYIIVGFVVIALGLITLPFLEYLVKDANIPDLHLIFMLFVINTASGYFVSYKGSLITAHQKNYIVTNVIYGTSILCYGIQMIVMSLTHNYILTLSIQVGTNALQGIITMYIADRMYPYIRGKNDSVLPAKDRKAIFKSMGSLMFYRAGQVVINGTDSLIISSIVGVKEAGVYSNYSLLTTTVKNLLQQVFNACTASIGNMAATESNRRKYKVYNAIFFGNFWMFGFAAVCFYVLFNPFVTIWAGKDLLLDQTMVVFIVLNFYLVGMRNVNTTFRDTMGVFEEGKFVPIISAIVNIVISILTAKAFGLIGAFIGTTVSMLTTLVWMEPVILFKHGFHRSPLPYFAKYIVYFGVTLLTALLTNFLAGLLGDGGLLVFAGKFLICMIVPNAIFYLLFHKTAEFQLLARQVKSVLGRKLGRKKHA